MHTHEKCFCYIDAVLLIHPDSILVIENYIITKLLL